LKLYRFDCEFWCGICAEEDGGVRTSRKFEYVGVGAETFNPSRSPEVLKFSWNWDDVLAALVSPVIDVVVGT
jgi:hypothetical protein